jgi:hypothetical protein
MSSLLENKATPKNSRPGGPDILLKQINHNTRRVFCEFQSHIFTDPRIVLTKPQARNGSPPHGKMHVIYYGFDLNQLRSIPLTVIEART